jgi:hypothetical protein
MVLGHVKKAATFCLQKYSNHNQYRLFVWKARLVAAWMKSNVEWEDLSAVMTAQ